jgi:predicted metal-dependent peptidase
MSNETPTVTRLKNAMIAMGWSYPFFLVPMGKIDRWTESKDATKTMSVSLSGEITVNPDFAAKLPDDELAGVGFHELFHMMLDHLGRAQGRAMRRWNRAADRSLNQALKEMGVKLPKTALYPEPGDEKLTAEEIYDKEPEQPEDEDPGYEPGAGAGCGPKDDTTGDGSDGGQSTQQAQREWAQAAATAQALAAGTGMAEVMARIFKAPRPRVKVLQVLRSAANQALAAHGRDDQAWSKRSRRSPAGCYLPGWIANQATMAFVMDTSGSVSDEEVEQCVGYAIALAKQHAGLKVFLALHTSECYWHGWIQAKSGEAISELITDRGGTDFDDAYLKVEECGKKIDMMVHLTDGECYGTWPGKPTNVRKLMVALTRGDEAPGAPEGSTIVRTEF